MDTQATRGRQGRVMQDAAIILAAGLGTRMRSNTPKAMHLLGGRSMLSHLVATCEAAGFTRVVVVIGPGMADLAAAASPHTIVAQRDRLGTAHATLQAMPSLGDEISLCLVLYADNPLLRADTLHALRSARPDGGLAMLAMRPHDPGAYGRVILNSEGLVDRIVEFADATPEERKLSLCNVGAFLANHSDLSRWLGRVRNDNARNEYYLTDIVAVARGEGRQVGHTEAAETECLGVNSRSELARAEAALQTRLRDAVMREGTTLIAPETVFLSFDTRLAADVIVHPHVVFAPGVVVEEAAEIRSFSHLEGCKIGARATVGPFARVRPGSLIGVGSHVGNFVELKNVSLGAGAKANHLTYLGDASVGTDANIGAGTITCNYDGFSKHRTTIGDRAFVGSNTALVAPVTVGKDAIVGAGSTIVRDVPEEAIAVARGVQVTHEAAATKFRARRSQAGRPRARRDGVKEDV